MKNLKKAFQRITLVSLAVLSLKQAHANVQVTQKEVQSFESLLDRLHTQNWKGFDWSMDREGWKRFEMWRNEIGRNSVEEAARNRYLRFYLLNELHKSLKAGKITDIRGLASFVLRQSACTDGENTTMAFALLELIMDRSPHAFLGALTDETRALKKAEDACAEEIKAQYDHPALSNYIAESFVGQETALSKTQKTRFLAIKPLFLQSELRPFWSKFRQR